MCVWKFERVCVIPHSSIESFPRSLLSQSLTFFVKEATTEILETNELQPANLNSVHIVAREIAKLHKVLQ